jgi:hypothetical protein
MHHHVRGAAVSAPGVHGLHAHVGADLAWLAACDRALRELLLGDDCSRVVGDPRHLDLAASLAMAAVSLMAVTPRAYPKAGRLSGATSTMPSGLALVRMYPEGSAIRYVAAEPKPGGAVSRIAFDREGTTATWAI